MKKLLLILALTSSVWGQHYISLSWTQSTGQNIVYNNVYRGSAHGGPYTLIYSSSPSTATFYNDYGCSGNCYYVVTAVSNGGGPPWPQTDWTKSTAYYSAQIICPTIGNAGHYSFYSLGGTSATSEPTWTQTPGNVTSADNTIAGWTNGSNVCVSESAYSNEVNGAEGTQASAPSCTPTTGTVPQTVTCTNPNGGTTILCYSASTTPVTNGSGTACTTGTEYTTALTISSAETLKMIAGVAGDTDSAVVSYTYGPPSPPSGLSVIVLQ